jgi:rhodanese-related sulfurtransferase
MAQMLIKKGFKRVYALKGGWRQWLKSGFLTEPKEAAGR